MSARTPSWKPSRRRSLIAGWLHPPGKPSVSRAEHLFQVQVAMLFLQGTRDEFARLELITGVCKKLGPSATLHLIDDADHPFKVPKRSGRTPEQVMAPLADTIAQ